jgi:hypothetical protein
MAAGQNVQAQSLKGLLRDGGAGGYFLHDLQIVHKNNRGRTHANPKQMGGWVQQECEKGGRFPSVTSPGGNHRSGLFADAKT